MFRGGTRPALVGSTFAAAGLESRGPGSGCARAVCAAVLPSGLGALRVLRWCSIRSAADCCERSTNPARPFSRGPWSSINWHRQRGSRRRNLARRGAIAAGRDCSPLPVGRRSRLHGWIPMAVADTATLAPENFPLPPPASGAQRHSSHTRLRRQNSRADGAQRCARPSPASRGLRLCAVFPAITDRHRNGAQPH